MPVPDGRRLLKMVLDLGSSSGFSPDDILVVIDGRKVSVNARSEMTSSTTGKTTHRQFSRQLDINETIVADRSAVSAIFDHVTGRLLVVAAVQDQQGDVWAARRRPLRTAGSAVLELIASTVEFRGATACSVDIR